MHFTPYYLPFYYQDTEINVERLIQEWMGLGYLGSVTGNSGAEVKGKDYFNSLAMLSLFQDIEESDEGEIVGCKMHDIVHDFALFLRVNNNDRIQVGCDDTTKSSCQVCSPPLVYRVREYRSLVWDEEEPTSVCDCLTSVRVFRLKPYIFNGPPKGMEKLIHLRWLELSSSDVEELVKDAREAELRSKIHIHTLFIAFDKEEVQQPSSSLWMELMEALEPNQQKLIDLYIRRYMGPQWISSPLSLVKGIHLYNCHKLSSLPALGKLPCLESLRMRNMYKLKSVGRELLGIQSSSSSSSSSSSTKEEEEVVVFPKLMDLTICNSPEWWEWEDITAEEEECISLSIMPCLQELRIESCWGLKKLPHRLLRKASSSLRYLNISSSPLLLSQYGGKDSAEWRYISQYNPKLKLIR